MKSYSILQKKEWFSAVLATVILSMFVVSAIVMIFTPIYGMLEQACMSDAFIDAMKLQDLEFKINFFFSIWILPSIIIVNKHELGGVHEIMKQIRFHYPKSCRR